MIRVLRCADYPAHARVVREPLRPACVADSVDTLLAAGWTPADTRAGGLWRDPADGSTRTEAHALRLAQRDAGEVRT